MRIFAFSSPILKLQAKASSKPPPNAKPSTPAITRFPIFSIALATFWASPEVLKPFSSLRALISLMFNPAENAFPHFPVTMTTLILSSDRTFSKIFVNSNSTSLLRTFNVSGRLIVTIPILFFLKKQILKFRVWIPPSRPSSSPKYCFLL